MTPVVRRNRLDLSILLWHSLRPLLPFLLLGLVRDGAALLVTRLYRILSYALAHEREDKEDCDAGSRMCDDIDLLGAQSLLSRRSSWSTRRPPFGLCRGVFLAKGTRAENITI